MSTEPVLDLGGRLNIVLGHSAETVTSVEIRSSRPVLASRVLSGRTPAEAVRLVPLVFGLCGGAQRIATLIAYERALGLEPAPREQAARRLVLEVERVREHGLRLLTDWPAALGLFPDRESAARLFVLQRRLAGDRDSGRDVLQSVVALIRDSILGEDWEAWVESDASPSPRTTSAMLPRLLHALQARDWLSLGAGGPIPALEDFSDENWRIRLDTVADDYALQPDIGGEARETTPYARQIETPLVAAAARRWGDGLATRLLALAYELNSTLPKLQDCLEQAHCAAPAEPLDDESATGEGVGIVEAARGRLMHRIALSQGRITRYQIVAPTEWNFHPRGVAARTLARLPFRSAETCAAQARALICAIDPCVAYDLDVRRHA